MHSFIVGGLAGKGSTVVIISITSLFWFSYALFNFNMLTKLLKGRKIHVWFGDAALAGMY